MSIHEVITAAAAIYSRMNNNGEGFSVGDATDQIDSITGIGELVAPINTTDDIAIYQDGNRITLVGGDGMGVNAWAVEMDAAHEKTCWRWAVDQQGYTGTFADWLVMDDGERAEYEDGAAGIPTA